MDSSTCLVGNLALTLNIAIKCRWAMSSLTLKSKPSEQAPLAPANSSAPLASASSNDSSGIHLASISIFTSVYIH